jgi:ATP-dependent DNA ligase
MTVVLVFKHLRTGLVNPVKLVATAAVALSGMVATAVTSTMHLGQEEKLLDVCFENRLPLPVSPSMCVGLRVDLTRPLMPPPKRKATFIEPMLLLRKETLPAGESWLYELDGFRAFAYKTGGKVHLRSRNDKDFSTKYAAILKALAPMPDETVIDGEIVALDLAGPPSFNALQNHGSGTGPLFYYVFDVMVIAGREVMGLPLQSRRELLRHRVLAKLADPIRESPELEASLLQLIQSVKAKGLEGLIAKRRDSRYEPGQRSGAWQKMRVNQGQEFVIAGYTPSARSFDALIFGYYEGDQLIYVAAPGMASLQHHAKSYSGGSGGWRLRSALSPICRKPRSGAGVWGSQRRR